MSVGLEANIFTKTSLAEDLNIVMNLIISKGNPGCIQAMRDPEGTLVVFTTNLGKFRFTENELNKVRQNQNP